MSLAVPVLFAIDVVVMVNYNKKVEWPSIWRLLPPTCFGVFLGSRLIGTLTSAQAKLLVGTIISGILLLNLWKEVQAYLARDTDKTGVSEVSDQKIVLPSLWLTATVGVVGGFATILTNSMGPLLNVYLLSMKLDPVVFVGTRGAFFTFVNVYKITQRMISGTLTPELIMTCVPLMVYAIVGVAVSSFIVKQFSKSVFMAMEYTLMSLAAFKLLRSGLQSA
eukprot:m.242246 g.242246  ORF g.242246 m.242246 type:complete len:221 (+) comp19438_c0_seq5:838-1500(+)